MAGEFPHPDQDNKHLNRYTGRRLLSIGEEGGEDSVDGHCDKDDPDCDEKEVINRYTEDNAEDVNEGQSGGKSDHARDTDDIIEQLDTALKDSKKPISKKKSKASGLERCQKLLIKAQDLEKKSAKSGKTMKKLGKLNLKQKLEALKGFMGRMTETKVKWIPLIEIIFNVILCDFIIP